jgi:endonuclease/exonuclease/phosphatase (EEP) superfamily protein YafD
MRLVPITGLLAVAMLGSDPASAATINVALASAGGVAKASTNTSTQALVNDGNTAAQGWVAPTSGATIKVDWVSAKAVNRVTAIFANANSKTFKFQYWDGSGWINLSPTFSSNTMTTVTYTPGSPVSTQAVRLNFTGAAASVFVNELQAFHEEPDPTTGTNVALASAGGVAKASTNTSTQALVNDGNTAAQGWAVPTSGGTIKVDWVSAKPVNRVAAIFANANSKTFKFQYWDGSGWVDLSPTFSSNTETTVTYIPGSPIATQAVRLNFVGAAASVFVNELQAYAAAAALSRLKVVTWNLNRRSTAGTAQGDKLAAQAADLILAQEVAGEAHANTIAAALGTEWAYRFHGTSTEGVAVFYKTNRLTAVEGEKFDVGPSSWGGVREAGRIQFIADGKTFYAFVAHLDWPQDNDWTDPNEEHVQNRNNLAAELRQFSGRKIFGGDMNARYTGNSVQRGTIEALDALGVDSCFVRATDPALDTDAEKHLYCDRNFATVNSRLDHLHATNEFTQVSHNVVNNDRLSDHKLVVAEFDIQ